MHDLLTRTYYRNRLKTWLIVPCICNDKPFTIGDRTKIGAARARA